MSKLAAVTSPAEDADSDEAIEKMLSQHPGLLNALRAEADSMINKSRTFWFAPRSFIDWQCRRLSACLRAANAPLPLGDLVRQDPVLLRQQHIAHFRIYKEAVATFGAILKRCEQGPAGSKQWAEECEQVIRDHEHAKMVRSQQHVQPPPFDGRGYVERMAARGVVLVADAEGALSATPSSKLTEQDRVIIHANRAAIAAAAASLVETF